MLDQQIAQLPDSLSLRRGRPDDLDGLLALYARCMLRNGEPDIHAAAWARDLFRGHPTIRPSDFTIVQDGDGTIVSSLFWISQRWSYAGIEFKVGRPELVATLPEYRERGLVRRQFEVVHGWSAERGEQVQAITGIPFYYRQFGYEMAVTLGGSRSGPRSNIPTLKPGEVERYRVRPALEEDLPFLRTLYEASAARYPMTVLRDEALWRHDVVGRDPEGIGAPQFRVIESADGYAAGGMAVMPYLRESGATGKAAVALFWEMAPGVSWLSAAPSVARYLLALGDSLGEKEGTACTTLHLQLGAEHPAYEVMRAWLPQVRPPYAWYLRVPDLNGFIRHIAPALEGRLARSPASGHTGELKISFYRTGTRLVFEEGRLSAVEHWKPTSEDGGQASFPGLTFLQLLFGYRELDELRYAFPDCRCDGDEARVLLEALFPKASCDLWPVE